MFLEFDSTHHKVFWKNFNKNFSIFVLAMLVFCCFEALNIKILAKMCVICWNLIFYFAVLAMSLIQQFTLLVMSLIQCFTVLVM